MEIVIVAIVSITLSGAWTQWLKHKQIMSKKADSPELSKRIEQLESMLESGDAAQLADLQRRVEVLEEIVVSDKSDLEAEFESLEEVAAHKP